MLFNKKITVRMLSLTSAVILSSCVVAPGNNAKDVVGSNGYSQQAQQSSGTSEYDRGCADAKSGSYDRSGNAGQNYEQGWKSCQSNSDQSSVPLGQTPPVAQDLVGARAAGAMDDLEKRGLQFVRTEESGAGKNSFWRELGTGGCIFVRTADGKIETANYTDNAQCR